MSYPLRDERPGSIHHVGTRGNNQRPIFVDDGSRVLFLLRLAIVARANNWAVSSYCLMGNHYHLILKLGELGMAHGMQQLNGGYAAAFNARYGRRDHLFGRRYWNRELEDDDDLLETARYIDLNPCRKGLVGAPAEWRWSGHRAAVGLTTTLPFHQPAELWRLFDKRPRVAMTAYERFVAELPIGARPDQPRPVSDTGVRVRPR